MKQKMELAALLLVGGIPLAQAASVVVDAANSPWSTVSGSLATAGSGALGTVSGSTGTTSGAVDTVPPIVITSAAPGTYPAPINVYLKATDNKDPSPTIYYTVNGDYPTTKSMVYSQGIYVHESHDDIDSDIRTLVVDRSGNWARQRFTYRIEDKLAPSVSATVAPGTYHSPQSIVLRVFDGSDAKPQLYYTTDGSLPKKQKSYLYKPGKILVAKDIGQDIDLSVRTLTVDSSKNWKRDTLDYHINKNNPPVSSFTVASSGSMATFITTGSKDEDGFIKSMEWTFGDEGASKAVTSFTTVIGHHYKKLGTYNVKLKVIDDLGASAISTQSVTIKTNPGDFYVSGRLNDTGITQCTNGTDSPVKCPVSTLPKQDAQYGEDSTRYKSEYDGHAGFSFVLVDYTGYAVPYYAFKDINSEEHCVLDTHTGLVWEIKSKNGTLRDKDNTYTWFNENRLVNNNDAGLQSGGKCSGDISCDSDAYIKAVNKSALCGYTDWRLPTASELLGIVDFSVAQPGATIDQTYFSDTVPDNYLTSDSYSAGSAMVRVVSFSSGAPFFNQKSTPAYIRLVRSDKKQ